MFSYTDTKDSPWWVVNADDKRRARLNMIHHLLSQIPYEDVTPKDLKLPERPPDKGYVRPPIESRRSSPRPTRRRAETAGTDRAADRGGVRSSTSAPPVRALRRLSSLWAEAPPRSRREALR